MIRWAAPVVIMRPRREAREILLAGRSVERWEDFPPETRAVYARIAQACHPFVPYACGSRLHGYYLDSLDDRARVLLRIEAGLPPRVSDFDFWVDSRCIPGPLPDGADRMSGPPPLRRLACRMDIV